MRAVASPPLIPWLFMRVHDDEPMIHVKRAAPVQRWRGVARLPSGWLEVPGGRVQSAQQMFASYHRSGVRPVQYYCSNLASGEPPAQVIALINLGECRVSVSPAGNGYEARWQAGDTSHRLTGGPVELAAFMEFVLSLTLR